MFVGINTFNKILKSTGCSKTVLSNRIKWLIHVGCLTKTTEGNQKRATYRLTEKAHELYQAALMALMWERKYYVNPNMDNLVIIHNSCGNVLQPNLNCKKCDEIIKFDEVFYRPGPGATYDDRPVNTRKISNKPFAIGSPGHLYNNLVDLVGSPWTANV